MNTTPLISIIVPVYNAEKYLDECIISVLAQTYQNIECILVDDGSTDSSGSICDKYAVIDKRVFVVHKINGGVISARKEGVLYANGAWIYFMDADDTIYPDTIKSMSMYMDDSIDIIMFEENNNKIYTKEEYVSGLLTQTIRWSNCGKLHRKTCFNEYTFRTSRFFHVGEDFLTSLRMAKGVTKQVLACNIHKYNYRIVGNSAMSSYKHSLDYEQKIIAEVDAIIKDLDVNVKEAHFHYNTMMLGGMIGLQLLNTFDNDWIKSIVSQSKTVKMNFRQKLAIMATKYSFCRYILIMERKIKRFVKKLLGRR